MVPPGRVEGHDDYDNDDSDGAITTNWGEKKADARHLTITSEGDDG
jgi:hypothetical protein